MTVQLYINNRLKFLFKKKNKTTVYRNLTCKQTSGKNVLVKMKNTDALHILIGTAICVNLSYFDVYNIFPLFC
jgi:hypothetical protein